MSAKTQDAGAQRAAAGLQPLTTRRDGKQDPEYRRLHLLTRRYGLTPEDYQRLLDSQGGACAICGREQSANVALAVDHDHDTGVIRGLLCHRCNSGIGSLGDSVALLKLAIWYLEHPPAVAILSHQDPPWKPSPLKKGD